MPAPRAPTVPQFARRLAIETPEHLVLELELAGVGSRIAAAACDAVLLGVLYVGLAFVLFHPQNRRLGDIVAGTVVARDRPEDLQLAGVPADRQPAAEPLEAGPPELTDEEFRLLDQYLERLESLDAALRRRFTADLAARFAPRFPRRDADPEAFLGRLHTAEFAKRSGRLAARRTEGAGRTTVAAERFVTRKRDSWEAFRILAAPAERVGLKQLG